MVKLQLDGERRKAAEPEKNKKQEDNRVIAVVLKLEPSDDIPKWKKTFMKWLPYIAMGMLLFQLGAVVHSVITK